MCGMGGEWCVDVCVGGWLMWCGRVVWCVGDGMNVLSGMSYNGDE